MIGCIDIRSVDEEHILIGRMCIRCIDGVLIGWVPGGDVDRTVLLHFTGSGCIEVQFRMTVCKYDRVCERVERVNNSWCVRGYRSMIEGV